MALLAWSLAVPQPGFSATATPQASEWSVEVTEALNLYRAGDYPTAGQLCMQLLSTSGDTRVRRDAAALHTMILLRAPARADRLEGRARLTQLSAENPSLRGRPECDLALGIAATALAETATALTHLEDATEGFAARNQPDRLAVALTALAEAWSRHGEWEFTPPRFNVPRPQSPKQARQIRREQVGRVRDRLAKVPGSDDALARVDLLLAEDFITAGDRVADGLKVLEQIAAAPRMTPAVSEAALKLAQYYGQEQRWLEGLALYRRLIAEAATGPARQAKQRIAEITRPRLVLDVPASVSPDEPVRVHLQVRNVEAVELEMRRVALGSWLARRQGRLVEALLPTAGSVQWTRRFDTRVARKHDWWRSDGLEQPLAFSVSAGAYVVIANVAGEQPELQPVKRLVIVSDLTAAVFAGPLEALIWAAPSKTLDGEAPTAEFWMHGSFVPTQPRFEAGIAHFALPPEATVLRDRRWVCLVRAGEHLALCRGKLRSKHATRAVPAVALLGSPPEPSVGQTLTLIGVVLSGRAGAAPSAGSAGVSPAPGGGVVDETTWRLEARDMYERTWWQCSVEPSPAGVFSAQMPITAELEGKHLRVIVRRGEQVAENVSGRFALVVAPADKTDLIVSCKMPPWLAKPASEVPVHVRAWYPWGTELASTPVRCDIRAAELPTFEPGAELLTAGPFIRKGRLEPGGLGFNIPVDGFDLPDGPRVLGVQAIVDSWEGHQSTGFGETLLGSEAEALIPRSGAEPLRVSRTLHVRAHQAGAGTSLPRLQCDARLAEHDGKPGVRVHLTGSVPQPAIALVEAGDPLAARVLPSIDGLSEVFLPLEATPPEARVVLVAVARTGLEILADEDVRPSQAQVVSLDIEPPSTPLLPNESVRIGVTCARIDPSPKRKRETTDSPATDTTLIARLVSVAEAGYVHWQPRQQCAPTRPAPSGPAIASSLSHGPASGEAVTGGIRSERLPLPPSLAAAWYEGTTLWSDVRPVSAVKTELDVPLPVAPGLYRLIVLARGPRGATATGEILLDTRRGLRVIASAPKRLTLGDRTIVAVMLENTQVEPAETHVLVDVCEGLHVESIAVRHSGHPGNAARPADSRESDAANRTGEPVPLIVPAGERAWFQMRVEAVRIGGATLRAEVELPDGRQHAYAAYEVLPVDRAGTTETAKAPLRLKRTLLRVIEERVQLDPTTGEPSEEGVWKTKRQHAVLTASERVEPGQKILVRDEFTLEKPLTAVTWFQRLPPNCRTLQNEPRGFKTADDTQCQQLDASGCRVLTLAAGRHTHEYPIVAVRPGVCLLPLPEVIADGQSLPVIVKPGEILINVVGRP